MKKSFLDSIGVIGLALGLVGCGSEDANEPKSSDPAVIDDLAVIPETPTNSIRIDFPEQEIASGDDRMMCFYPPPTDQEYFVQGANAYQGDYGHHLLLFKSILNKAPGTVEDCTDEAAMASFLPNIFTSEFAGGEIPEGYAVRVPANTQIVLQQHYVNTTAKAIRVRDAVFLHKTDPSQVEHELGFLAMTSVDFQIPPKSTGHAVSVECSPPEDGSKILLMGPHMHEHGERITLEKSSDGGTSWEMIQDVEEWDPSFRDLPPVQRWFDTPMVVGKADKLRLTCYFGNAGATGIGFPKEMCAYYGYFLTPTSAPSWLCLPE
jgi:hypothetical protein